jgi:ATP-dependent DNA helicase RecG
MEPSELSDIIQKGESTKIQFKERLPHPDSLAQEMAAFSNTEGGLIIIGVNDKSGALNGLSFTEIQATNMQLVNVASQSVFPPVIITTETVTINGNNLLVVTLKEGISKPYKDRNGSIFVKNGSDKRKVTSNDEIARLLQSSKVMFADELPIPGTSVADIDLRYYKSFIERKFRRSFEDLKIGLPASLQSQNLLKDNELTLAGVLLFCSNRQKYRPQYSVQCVAVDATDLTGNNYADNEPAFDGNLEEVYSQTMAFLNRNLKKIQSGKSFNSPAVWEIPYEVFEELIVNALIHRDYFVSTTIKVRIFSDRVEIESPGKLPNSLTENNVKNGISIPRNPVLQSLAQYLLPYKGLGTGIPRAFSIYPHISLNNQPEMDRFIVKIQRPQ